MSEDTGAAAPEQSQETGWTPPASQADLDRIISDRVARERAKFADYDDLKAAAGRLAEIEEANKTELEKAIEKATAAEQRLAALEATNRRLAAIARHQIPGDYADLVTGSTDEELEASAQKVSALIAAQTSTTPGPLVLPSVNSGEPPALNSDALEEALRRAVGAN